VNEYTSIKQVQVRVLAAKGATREGLRGLKPPSLAKSKLKKIYEVLIFSRFRAYNPIKIIIQQYNTLPVI